MASPKFNSKSPTIKRILKEASELSSNPAADYHALPASDSDLFDWHFTIRGPPATPYADGLYHGRIVLPPTYPLRPPSFRFLTPSGRFEVNREICLSISGHHEETWQPAWGIRTALVALRAFMESDAKGQLGGLESSQRDRERFAGMSGQWKCGVCARCNEDILKETGEAARIKDEQDVAAGKAKRASEVEIPKELKLGYKDELAAGAAKQDEIVDGEEAELAEGFVQTHPVAPVEASAGSGSHEYPPARPAQSVAQPTGSTSSSQANPPPPAVTAPAQIAHAYPQQHTVQRVSDENVPVWVDRAIAGVVLCLVFMILKMLLGF